MCGRAVCLIKLYVRMPAVTMKGGWLCAVEESRMQAAADPCVEIKILANRSKQEGQVS